MQGAMGKKKSHIVSAAWAPLVFDAWMGFGRQNDIDPELSPPVTAFTLLRTGCTIAPARILRGSR